VAVVADPAITGGLVAVTADGSLTVVNTLDSRLERCWPDLLPHLIAELRGRPA
jgi:vacuolar-type H+-ATPase subunit E/Vma4